MSKDIFSCLRLDFDYILISKGTGENNHCYLFILNNHASTVL